MPRRKKAEESIPKVEVTPAETTLPAETSPAPAPVLETVAPAPVPESPAPAPGRPTLEERRMAAVAHGSILLNLVSGGFLGPVVALIVWLLYDRKSEYISWHALQALVFQGLSLLLFLVLGVITALLWGVTALLMPIVIGFCLVPLALAFSTITAALVVGSLIYGCAGALAVLDGRDFRYRWVADMIPPLGRP
jgi:uncharacterized Tic20 family protein